MASWHRPARLLIAVAGAAFAVALGLAFQKRAAYAPPTSIERSDPAAVVESAGGRTIRLTRDKEDVRIEFDRLLTYPDGSKRMQGVTVTATRDSGRTYTIRGAFGQAEDGEGAITLEGNVTLTSDDGLTVKTERAQYVKQEGGMNAPGLAEFSRGRLTGSGIGVTYDERQDILTLLDQATVRIAPGNGESGLRLTSGLAEYRRQEHLLRFDRSLHAVRDRTVMDADQGTARLDAEDERVQLLELRGNARIVMVPNQPGGVELLVARDIDLQYAADGETLERSRQTEGAVVQVAGEPGQPSRRIRANTLEVTLAGGSLPTALAGRGGVELELPGAGDAPARSIASDDIDATGDATHGLTNARFVRAVKFRERVSLSRERAARAGVLETSLTPGLGSIDEARFQQNVRFEDADLTAEAAVARYRLSAGSLELSGSEPGRERPHLTHTRVGVYAVSMMIGLEGPEVHAAGDVKSVLLPARASGEGEPIVVPSMLDKDKPVNVTATDLVYSAPKQRAVYSGSAWLWQGETSIKADSLTVDDKAGDLSAGGSVATTGVFEQTENGRVERVRTTTTSKQFEYTEEVRRATYTGAAHVTGIQGDVTAEKIELFLKPSGNELERAEAYEKVTLREKTRKTTGARMTYLSAEERYVVTGTPVLLEDSCGRETTGRTLTFFRSTDRIIVDGNELIRTQSKGGTKCPGTA